MRNYIRADIKRILRNSSHLFSMLLLYGIYFCLLYLPNRTAQTTSVSLIVSACSMLEWIMVFAGLFEMIAVFSEDFKVKTMQVAIGLGVSREKVVLCKLAEAAILLILDSLMFVVITLMSGAVLGVSIPLSIMKDLFNLLFIKGLLGNLVYISLTMIVPFVTSSMVLTIFAYIFVSFGVINLILTFLPMFGFAWLEELKLTRITLSYQLSLVHTRLALGAIDFVGFLNILIHFGAGIFATCKVFQKRELDF